MCLGKWFSKALWAPLFLEETPVPVGVRGTLESRTVNSRSGRYDVESLCRGFPKRVQLLVEGKGKKLRT